MYRFDMRQVLANRNGPFLLPDRRYTGIKKSPYQRARISSVSTDWSRRIPTLVTAEYKKCTDATAEVVRWPLWSGGGLRVRNRRVNSDYDLWIDRDSTIDKVQGVESHRGVWFFSSSQGRLHRARLETQRDRDDRLWGPSWPDSDIPQDLYAVPGHRMYGQTEERTDRRIFWQPMRSVMP